MAIVQTPSLELDSSVWNMQQFDDLQQVLASVRTALVDQEIVLIELTDVYPVNSIYLSISSTNPNTTFGFGTWVAFGEGLYLVGVPSGGTGEGTAGIALSNQENRPVGQHSHSQFGGPNQGIAGGGGLGPNNTNPNTGTAGSVAGTNAPYIQVYMWKRTA